MKQITVAVSQEPPPSSRPAPAGCGSRCVAAAVTTGSSHSGRGEQAAQDGCQGKGSTCEKTPTVWGWGLPSGPAALLPPPQAPPGTLRGPVGTKTWAAVWVGTGSPKLVAKGVSMRPERPSGAPSAVHAGEAASGRRQTTDLRAVFSRRLLGARPHQRDRAQSDTTEGAGTEAWGPGPGRRTKPGPGET